jgi:hypothetical protein
VITRLIEDELMTGAIDLHAHGYPEISLNFPGRKTDIEWAQAARDIGMGGFVIKSHIWPTMDRAQTLQIHFPEMKIFGSITLNENVGGFSPWSVESAIRLGGRVIWLPTWSARFDIEHHAGKYFRRHLPFYNRLTPERGLSLRDDSGSLRNEVKEIIGMARQADLIVGTGHISPAESLAVAQYCQSLGFGKLVFTHPLSLGASLSEIDEVARMGFYVELTYLHLLLQVLQISQVLEIIQKIGPQRCLLTTDAFFSWTPSAPEMLRMFVGILHHFGAKPEDLRKMVYENPRKLLGL